MFTDWKGIKQNTCSWSRLIILEANDRAFTTLGGSNSGTASDSAGGDKKQVIVIGEDMSSTRGIWDSAVKQLRFFPQKQHDRLLQPTMLGN